MNLFIFSGFLIGILFGFVMQRGNLCALGGFTDAIFLKKFKTFRVIFWALLISLICFNALDGLRIITLNPRPFFWGASIIGGIIYGIGMAIAGGCIGSISYKAASGFIGYFIAGAGIATGGYIASEVFIKPINFLREKTEISSNGQSLTLSALLHVNSWVIIAILSVIFIFLIIKLKDESEKKENFSFAKIFSQYWPAALTGIMLGIIEIFAFITSASAGRNYPLSLIEGYTSFFKALLFQNLHEINNWAALLIPGIFIGSIISYIGSGGVIFKLPSLKNTFTMLFGGFLIGVGSVMADGDTITHVLSGIPQLSVGSMASSAAVFAGAYIVIYLKIIKNN